MTDPKLPLIIGNWKMHGTRASVHQLLSGLKTRMPTQPPALFAVCAPAIFLADIQQQLADSLIAWGGQDISMHTAGAYTGEIAGAMLHEFGCRYVIVGHSERRTNQHETNRMVAKKYAAALRANLTPILCIGETWQQREQNQAQAVIAEQLQQVIEHNGIDALARGIIAYEPIWAIGTGKTATPEQAQMMHRDIRQQIAAHNPIIATALPLLYGGSMQPNNAANLLSQPDIDGGLIGGASLQVDHFLAIGGLE